MVVCPFQSSNCMTRVRAAKLDGSERVARLSQWQDAGKPAPAHGEDSLCCRHTLLHQAALQGEQGGGGPGGDADLGVEILDVVVGGLGGDLELAGGFLGGVSGCNQP